jgi:hypothetical protein
MLAVRELHQRLDHGLAATLGAPWHPSIVTWDDFATAADGAQRAHLAFVVAVPRSISIETGRRSRPGEPLLVRSEVRIRWMHRLRAGVRSDDYREALDAEATILTAAMSVVRSAELVPELRDTARSELPSTTGGYLLGEIELSVLHTIAGA